MEVPIVSGSLLKKTHCASEWTLGANNNKERTSTPFYFSTGLLPLLCGEAPLLRPVAVFGSADHVWAAGRANP